MCILPPPHLVYFPSSQTPSSFYHQPHTLEIEGKDVAGLLRNRNSLYTEAAEHTTAPIESSGSITASGKHVQPPIVTIPFHQVTTGLRSVVESQQTSMSSPAAPAPASFKSGRILASPSLKDLLLEKWPPAPLHQLIEPLL